jgi:hypothetical protein
MPSWFGDRQLRFLTTPILALNHKKIKPAQTDVMKKTILCHIKPSNRAFRMTEIKMGLGKLKERNSCLIFAFTDSRSCADKAGDLFMS